MKRLSKMALALGSGFYKTYRVEVFTNGTWGLISTHCDESGSPRRAEKTLSDAEAIAESWAASGVFPADAQFRIVH